MNNSIWRFELSGELEQEIEMFLGATILCIKTVSNKHYLYAKVDLDREKMVRKIKLIPTNQIRLISPNWVYIDTFLHERSSDDQHIIEAWHVYEA